jgi:NitT/TauT family transport system permease protein
MKKTIFIGPIVIILIWFIVSFFKIVNPFFLPSPLEVLINLYSIFKTGEIFPDLFATLIRTLEAFLIAIIFGIPLGLFLGEKEKIYRNIEFIIDFFRSTPATALFPLFLLIFGISDNSKIAVAAFGACLIIIFNTAYGVFNAKKSRILATKIMGATKVQIFKWIIFWESLPQTFVGIRNAISLSLVIIVVTEMFIGTNFGLGHRIIDSQLIYDIKGMYSAIIITGVLGYLLNYIVLFLEKKYIHWSGK